MNKIVEAVVKGQEVDKKELFNSVNDFELTRLRVSTEDGQTIMSMQVNSCKRCFVFYKNPVIEDIKTKADAESKEKYNNNYLNIKKNTTDKKISGLIKKSMEETRNNGKIIL